jgi:hypothetical protein
VILVGRSERGIKQNFILGRLIYIHILSKYQRTKLLVCRDSRGFVNSPPAEAPTQGLKCKTYDSNFDAPDVHFDSVNLQ